MSSVPIVVAQVPPVSGPPAVTAPPTTQATTQVPNPGIVPQPPALSGLPAGLVGGAVTVSLLFASLIVAFIAVKVYKTKVSGIVLGVCIGTLGATGFVGALAWAVISIFVTVVMAVADAIG